MWLQYSIQLVYVDDGPIPCLSCLIYLVRTVPSFRVKATRYIALLRSFEAELFSMLTKTLGWGESIVSFLMPDEVDRDDGARAEEGAKIVTFQERVEGSEKEVRWVEGLEALRAWKLGFRTYIQNCVAGTVPHPQDKRTEEHMYLHGPGSRRYISLNFRRFSFS